MKKKIFSFILTVLMLASLLVGCGDKSGKATDLPPDLEPSQEVQSDCPMPSFSAAPTESDVPPVESWGEPSTAAPNVTVSPASFQYSDIPAYSSAAYVAVNSNVPHFTENELTINEFELYSTLDALGRCGAAFANVSPTSMPTEPRGSIGQVKPSGWHTVKYDWVDGKYLYNRCHLIGYQLTAENANEQNLITGTRYLNTEGMLPFENMVADYVKETGNHVAYRVTPVFEGNDLLAVGVLMEGYSVEDQGDGICFCVFAYNVQPGVAINYATGDSQADGSIMAEIPYESPSTPPAPEVSVQPAAVNYIANKNTKKFHYPSCSSVSQMNERNKWYYSGTANELVNMGYVPCKRCNPR